MNGDAPHGYTGQALLGLLNEASREFSGLATPGQIARAALLAAMGGLGARWGFVLLTGPGATAEDPACAEGDGHELTQRGLGSLQAARLQAGASRSWREWFPAEPPEDPPRQPHLITPARRSPDSPFPEDTALMVRWTLEGGCGGLLGLGPGLGGPYGPDQTGFLLSLAASLVTALGRAGLTGRLAAMSQALARRNQEMDRRIFQQDTLIQALSELPAAQDASALMDNALLFLMGAAGSGRGYLLIGDGRGRLAHFTGQGLERARVEGLDHNALRQAVTRGLFDSGGAKAGWLEDPERLAAMGLPPDCPGLWFVADAQAFGFAGLGPPLDARPLDASRRETLLALTGAFLTCLSRARLFDAARRLNLELAERNRELAATLEEITSCRIEIDGLERAKQRIKDLVVREMDRVSRVSRADFLILLIVSAAVGLLFNWASPSAVEIVPQHWSRPATATVEATEAKALLDSGGLTVVDARPQERFKQGHIPGAANLTPALFDFMYGMRLAKLAPDKPVLVYGRTVSRLYDEEVAGMLAKRGHKNVRLLQGGFQAWKDAGYPVKP